MDLNPLDVTDPDATAWLANLVWPEEDDRRARLRSASAVAAAHPPDLRQGDLLDALPGLVGEAASYGAPVVFHSAVIAYLEPADRRRYAELVTGLVDAGACRWVSNEGPRVLPEVTAPALGVPPAPAQFVVGLDGRALAWAHGHGTSMTWLDAARPNPASTSKPTSTGTLRSCASRARASPRRLSRSRPVVRSPVVEQRAKRVDSRDPRRAGGQTPHQFEDQDF